MKVLITGSSKGIGKGIAEKFLNNGHHVVGFDLLPATINHTNYEHYQVDVRSENLPAISDFDIVINNAGTQDENEAISTNLIGAINISNKYVTKNIKSVCFIASASATNGAEFPNYSASKGGIVTFMKNLALAVAKYGATCNSVSPGGVLTDSNANILNNEVKYAAVLNETLLNKWAEVEEIANLVYFLCIENKSITGQDILIDNGEILKSNFIW